MLPKLCHLDNDLEIIIIIKYIFIYCVVHMTYIPYLGTFFFSRYPSVALARNGIHILRLLPLQMLMLCVILITFDSHHPRKRVYCCNTFCGR